MAVHHFTAGQIYNANLDFGSFCYTVAGCQTHFHWGPYQRYVCPQRARCNC